MSNITTILNMVEVNEKFSTYVVDRSTELNRLVTAGVATADPVVGQLINGTPQGGRFIEIPAWEALDSSVEEDVFGEEDVTVGGITTKSSHATLMMRQRAWGSTDLARVLGGADPMAAIGNLLADYWNSREQAMYLAILKGILDPTSGSLKEHVLDISAEAGEAACISDSATLDCKQLLGDHYGSLGMVFMHSAVYTYLQKKGLITRNPIFDPSQSAIEMERYLGYRIIVDDGMPVNTETGVYTTYLLGANAFIRQMGTPQGFIGTEVDRDKLGAKDYLINRRCMILAPRGFSWNTTADLTENFGGGTRSVYYPNNTHLANPANWTLSTHHKKIPIAALVHKI